jgi:hypothetical protein
MAYEFSDNDAATIKAVGTRLIFQGIFLFLIGLAGLAYLLIHINTISTFQLTLTSIQYLGEMLVGVALLYSPTHFNKVATTKGKDIQELITGFKKLSTSFLIVWLVVVMNVVLDIIMNTMDL